MRFPKILWRGVTFLHHPRFRNYNRFQVSCSLVQEAHGINEEYNMVETGTTKSIDMDKRRNMEDQRPNNTNN